ncbi:predicted protein [Nematostella vectensis]|uniref:Acyl-coenzyme A thioesterase THEM4 n=1 Tax=Nematostella vectensis TaxID=45351 RepID=A7S9S6_NEMVE|nr:predicted protein [Nematostella vectensis]|eukprot:XP_001631626.1 predicted protein [Nematostella vectensis]
MAKEFAAFANKSEKKLHLCGPYTEGPAGFVHDGAIAVIFDIGCACLSYTVTDTTRGGGVITANLSVNFNRAVPLNSTVLLHPKVEHVEGKKIYCFAELKSADGLILYATATALFIKIRLPQTWVGSLIYEFSKGPAFYLKKYPIIFVFFTDYEANPYEAAFALVGQEFLDAKDPRDLPGQNGFFYAVVNYSLAN